MVGVAVNLVWRGDCGGKVALVGAVVLWGGALMGVASTCVFMGIEGMSLGKDVANPDRLSEVGGSKRGESPV